MLPSFVVAFLSAAIATLYLVRSARRHGHLSGDHDFSGPQKFHARVVPRIGGVGLLVGLCCGTLVLATFPDIELELGALLLLCSLPAFIAGVVEDVSKKVTARWRLLATVVSALLAAWVLGATVTRTDIPGLDLLAAYPWGATFLAVLAVAGVSNSINIIDGMNGLSSMCVAIMLAGLVYVASDVQDWTITSLGLAGVGAVFGFFIWNFPKGLIFLGDGGAYFIGFISAELAILLLHRHPEVSPMFPLLLCAYPISETLFSIYRRKFVRGRAVGMPDGIHLHSLIYRRLMRWALGSTDAAVLIKRNSMTSPYLWVLCSLSVIPAALWWHSTAVLGFFLALSAAAYVFLYASIVKFKTPRMLVRQKRVQRQPLTKR